METKYRLQEAFKPLGPESTEILSKSHVVVIGCGATGSHVVDTLARMGVGQIDVIDNDHVNADNLHRQLYRQSDVGEFKAEVLANHIRAINTDVIDHLLFERVTADNIDKCITHWGKPDLILDCTDNMETRWLINDYSVKYSIPWIYCGVGRSEGMVMTIIPGKTACLRCTGWAPKKDEDRPRGGIFPPAVAMLAAIQATNAIKVLVQGSNVDGYTLMLHKFDVWTLQHLSFNVQRNENCEVCGKKA